MPYMIVKEGSSFVVYKKGANGKPVGSAKGKHKKRSEADSQMSALYANEVKSLDLHEQSDVQYTTSSTNPGQTCSNCRWFNTYGGYYEHDNCRIVKPFPEAIEPNGWCNKHEVKPMRQPEPVPVYMVEKDEKKFDLISALKAIFLPAKGDDPDPLLGGFKVLPDGRWVGLWSNNFKDKVNEIFPYRAQDAYIARVKSGISPYPTLRFWHIKGTDSSKADTIGRIGNFTWASGVFDDDEKSQRFKSYYENNGPWGMSHGFKFYKSMRINGVYHHFDTFELSVLKPHAACNPYTMFKGDTGMKPTEEQKSELIKALGADLAAPIISAAEKGGDALEAAGVESKALDAPDPMGSMVVMAEAFKGMAGIISAIQTQQATLLSEMTAMKGEFAEFKGMETRGSKSSSTEMPSDNPMVTHLGQKNAEEAAGLSIIEQVMAGKQPVVNGGAQ